MGLPAEGQGQRSKKRTARSQFPEPAARAMYVDGWPTTTPPTLPPLLPATPQLSPPPLSLSRDGVGEPPTMEQPDGTMSSGRRPSGAPPQNLAAAVTSAEAAGDLVENTCATARCLLGGQQHWQMHESHPLDGWQRHCA